MNIPQTLFDGTPKGSFKTTLRQIFPYSVKCFECSKSPTLLSDNMRQIRLARKIFGPQLYSVHNPKFHAPHKEHRYKLIFKEKYNSMDSEWLHFNYESFFRNPHDVEFLKMVLDDKVR